MTNISRITLMAIVAFLSVRVLGQTPPGSHPLISYELELTNYYSAKSGDAIARLQQRIERNETSLQFEPQHGYLKSLLRELQVPMSSQLLVFSKTSLQRYHISSQSPRALFFDDRVYVAWIPGAPMLEMLAVDPTLGAVLYTLEQTNSVRPRFTRDNRCLECHVAPRTLDVPGALVRSVHASREGEVDLLSGAAIVSHRTPLKERWGGWYVTGAYGRLEHQGNHFSVVTPGGNTAENPPQGPAKDLRDLFDVARYPQPTSDIVALLVLEHQTHMENLLTRLNYEARASLRQWGHTRFLTNLAARVLNNLLFVDEATLRSAIQGGSEFTKWFEQQGPRDSHGRSLREFDLQTRLFKYPCSYLIYSEAFDALPREIKLQVYRRLHAVLTGQDISPEFRAIPAETRRAVFEILSETKSDVPAYWKL